ncbi:MAG: gliding motility-associated C-terminal domain-containing protein, partial [Bacteroidota bacterium]
TVIVSDSANCRDTAYFTITEPLPITFTLSVSSANVCAGDSLTLLTSTPNGGTPPYVFNWLPNGPVVSPTVPTTYSVTVTDAGGCISQTGTILVTPLASPIADFDTTSSGSFHQTYNFTDVSSGANTWYWILGDGNTSTSQNPNHTYQAGTYTVTLVVTNSSGCTDTITKVITIKENVRIPNVFTPNGDGINDEFWIPNTGFESFEIVVYNRWGLKLWETNSGDIRWDGRTAAGETVPDGTYYYLLKAVLKTSSPEGKKYESKGFIDLHK